MARNADSAPHGPATLALVLRLARPRRATARATPSPTTTVTDQQIRALVGAAHALAERQRARGVDSSGAASQERLARLDWVVGAGGRALGDRVGRVGTASDGTARHGAGTR